MVNPISAFQNCHFGYVSIYRYLKFKGCVQHYFAAQFFIFPSVCLTGRNPTGYVSSPCFQDTEKETTQPASWEKEGGTKNGRDCLSMHETRVVYGILSQAFSLCKHLFGAPACLPTGRGHPPLSYFCSLWIVEWWISLKHWPKLSILLTSMLFYCDFYWLCQKCEVKLLKVPSNPVL